ncbi:MAG TPA: hypothetical protein VMT00_06790 [Thermoanaerobaculia bacterium]|nr:hypothetical protein [Thermoanaerobaculia bacterium]
MSAAPDEVRRRRLYLDTSAYLCILLSEDGWREIASESEGAELLSSVLLVLEAKRNLVRLAREGNLSEGQFQACLNRVDHDAELFALHELTLELCQSNLMPVLMTPRSLDLAHLRTAYSFHRAEPVDRFVTMDDAQRQAAREMGLSV